MEAYYQTLLEHLDGYTVMGLFDGKRDITDIVTLQTGSKGRVFFFDQEPMIKEIDTPLWDYIFSEPTIFANSELDSADKDYVKQKYPNFIDWYFFSHGFVSREWFSAQRYNYAGWTKQKQLLLDCNLLTGPRQYRIYLAYQIFRQGYNSNSYVSFNGASNWRKKLKSYDYFNILKNPNRLVNRMPTENVSYDNWGTTQDNHNGLMQSRIPLDHYSHVNYILVAETVFTENKKHLTEKVFKPIAAGKPFILVAGANNLLYLKQYGFKTFDHLWNEDYDNVVDPKNRIKKIFNLIDTEVHLNGDKSIEKLAMFNEAHKIALENRTHFWSDEFYQMLLTEALDNLNVAKDKLASKNV